MSYQTAYDRWLTTTPYDAESPCADHCETFVALPLPVVLGSGETYDNDAWEELRVRLYRSSPQRPTGYVVDRRGVEQYALAYSALREAYGCANWGECECGDVGLERDWKDGSDR